MAAVDRTLPVNRWWCILCPMSFPSEEDMDAHYTRDHPTYGTPCTTCLNRFENLFMYEFHANRGHHRKLAFEVVKKVFGDTLFNDVSDKEFHLLVRNGADVPPGTPWPLEPAELSDYRCRSVAFAIFVEEENRKEEEREAKAKEEREQKEREEQRLAKERELEEKKRRAEARCAVCSMFASVLGRFSRSFLCGMP